MLEMKNITKNEAYEMYLKMNYDDIMPFDNSFEETFVSYIQKFGYNVIND